MSQAVMWLSIAYVALGILVLGLAVSTRWSVLVKVICIVLLSSLYFGTYLSLGGLQGWPTKRKLPERFLLLGSSVHEPDQKAGTPGVIYLWVASLEGDKPAVEPRAYQLSFSKQLQVQLVKAEKRMKDGVMQLGENKWISGTENSSNIGRFSEKKDHIRLYDMPDPEMPEK